MPQYKVLTADFGVPAGTFLFPYVLPDNGRVADAVRRTGQLHLALTDEQHSRMFLIPRDKIEITGDA